MFSSAFEASKAEGKRRMSSNQPGPYGQQPGQPGGQGPYQPGPYGQPQPGPNPYAQGDGSSQPGYGQQPPQAPGQPGVPPQQGYGYPGQPGPYGQQPPGQPPYGPPQQPGMPVPPQGGKNKGKMIAIVVGALAVVGAVVAGFLVVNGGAGDGDDIADDGKQYKLTAPQTVADEYQRSPTSSGDGGVKPKDADKFEEFGVKDPESVGAEYATGTEQTATQLQFGGVWGEIEDPQRVLDLAFGLMAQESAKQAGRAGGDAKVDLEGEPEEQQPESLGDDAVMKCQSIKVTAPEGAGAKVDSVRVPLCMWADHSTVALVTTIDPAAALTGRSTPLDEAAETAAKVRKDTRVEVS